MSQYESDLVRKFTLNERTYTIVTRWIYDDDPDLSHLTDRDNYRGESEKNIDEYMAQDKERLDAYGKTWWTMGCDVQVSITDGPWHTESGEALWGIESDVGENEYRGYIERELLTEAFSHLRQGIDTHARQGAPIEGLIT